MTLCVSGVAACVGSASCISKCVFSHCKIATLSSTINLDTAGVAEESSSADGMPQFRDNLPLFSFPAMIRAGTHDPAHNLLNTRCDCDAARLPGWRLTCAALMGWGRSSGGHVDAKEADGVWARRCRAGGVKEGGDVQIVYGKRR